MYVSGYRYGTARARLVKRLRAEQSARQLALALPAQAGAAATADKRGDGDERSGPIQAVQSLLKGMI